MEYRIQITSDDIDLVRTRANLEDIIRHRGITLKRGNQRELKGNCPFHREKTPSFWVDPHKGQYHCFGCGASGDVFTFVQKYDNMDFYSAVAEIAAESGVDLQKRTFEEIIELSMTRKRQLLPVLKALAFPGKRSQHPEVSDTVWEDYQNQSGVQVKNIPWPDYCVPIGDPRIPTINKYASERFSIALLQSLGVGGCLSGRYRNRMILPVFRQGELVFYQARDVSSKSSKGDSIKYTGPPNVSSGNHLGFLETAAKLKTEVVMCEGWFSALRAGPNAICSFSCNLRDTQVSLLKWANVQQICLCYDPDAWTTPAARLGQKERKPPVYRALMKLVSAGFKQIRCARLIGGDPDELGRTSALRRMIETAPVVSSELDIEMLFI